MSEQQAGDVGPHNNEVSEVWQKPKPVTPEFDGGQRKIQQLCDEILSLKPDRKVSFVDVQVDSDPEAIEARLKASSAGDVLLKEGESLSALNPDEHQPDLGLYVGSSEVVATSLMAWGWNFSDGSWSRELDIVLEHSNGRKNAHQTVKLVASSSRVAPQLMRDVWAYEYAETGYEGHNQVARSCSEVEVDDILDIVRRMLQEKRIEKQISPQQAADVSACARELSDAELTYTTERTSKGDEERVGRMRFDIPDAYALDERLKASPISDLLVQVTRAGAKKDRQLKDKMANYAPSQARLEVFGLQIEGSEYWERRFRFNVRYKHKDDETREVRQIIGLSVIGGPTGNKQFVYRYDDEAKDNVRVRELTSQVRDAGIDDADFLLGLASEVIAEHKQN